MSACHPDNVFFRAFVEQFHHLLIDGGITVPVCVEELVSKLVPDFLDGPRLIEPARLLNLLHHPFCDFQGRVARSVLVLVWHT
jgi:hypothetical protein